jgi:hypothetical protein
LKVIKLTADGQANRLGVEVGDYIVGINGKDVKEVIPEDKTAKAAVKTSSLSFGKYIDSLSRPLTLTTYRDGEATAAPKMVREITGKSVHIAAGQTFKQPVIAAEGCDVQFMFWVEEDGCDIRFSVQKQGSQDLIRPDMNKNSQGNPCGPLQLTMGEDSQLEFVFDNSHSWVRGKTLHYTIHVEGQEMSAAEKEAHFERESARAVAGQKLAEMGVVRNRVPV